MATEGAFLEGKKHLSLSPSFVISKLPFIWEWPEPLGHLSRLWDLGQSFASLSFRS